MSASEITGVNRTTKQSICELFFELNEYCKNPKNLNTRTIATIILKFEQCGSTIQTMQTEWQTV